MADETAIDQAIFNEVAIERLADPMITESPRAESTLDHRVRVLDDDGENPFASSDFDEAPGSFEDDVIGRLENLENHMERIAEGNTATQEVIQSIADKLALIAEQVEPTIQMVVESKFFKMFVPKPKPVKGE